VQFIFLAIGGPVIELNILHRTFEELTSIDRDHEIYTKLVIAVQSLEFLTKNIVLVVEHDDQVEQTLMQCKSIMIELGFDYQVIRPNQIKIKNKQPSILIEAALNKYKNALGQFTYCSLM